MKAYNYWKQCVVVMSGIILALSLINSVNAQTDSSNSTNQTTVAGIVTRVEAPPVPIYEVNTTAENRFINATFSTKLNLLLRDEIRDRIYVADSGVLQVNPSNVTNTTARVAIVNSINETVIKTLSMPGKITDMSLRKDNAQLAVASNGGISTIELNTFALKNLTLPSEIQGKVKSLAFDRVGRIICVTSVDNQWGWIYLLSANGATILKRFGVGQYLNQQVYGGLLKTNLPGTILYVGEEGISPTSMCKIKIIDGLNPVFLAEDTHGELGSNLRDFTISPRYNEIYLASGAPYGIQVVNSDTLRLITVLNTGAYPAGVEVSRDGSKIYGLPNSTYNNNLFEFDAKKRALIKSYKLLSVVYNGEAQPRGIAVERFAEKAFVIHGSDYDDKMMVQVVDGLSNVCSSQQ